MIRLTDLCKSYRTPSGPKIVADNINITIPSRRAVGLLGRNGAGKSTLMNIIGGIVKPDSGTIERTGTVSWPVGFAGSFHRDMTGAQNTKFIARVYGVDTEELSAYVEEFAELGGHFYAPVRSYSSGMRSRLAFGISMGIPFDTYLVDEVTAVGDAAFKRKSRLAFTQRMETSGALFVSHSTGQLRRFCNAGAVLENGRLEYFSDINDAIDRHHANMGSDEDE